MFRKHPKQPQDAIAALLQKYGYGEENLEKFIDACVSYSLLVSPTLKNQIIEDKSEIENYRQQYLSEFKKSVAYLKEKKLEDREKMAFDTAYTKISELLQNNSALKPDLK